MKYKVGDVLVWLPGGNQYKVIQVRPTKAAEWRGVYLLKCVDFWCPEDMGDNIKCWKEGDEMWVGSFHVDCGMKIY